MGKTPKPDHEEKKTNLYTVKPGLQLRHGQHLAMTPQLQQAIRLLQLSALELKQEVQDALESNLMLEVDEDTSGVESVNLAETSDVELGDTPENIPDELPVDTDWSSIYDTPVSAPRSNADSSQDYDFTAAASSTGLREHLRWQLNLTPFNDRQRLIAENIVDAISDDGYLTLSCADFAESMEQQDISEEAVEKVLKIVQEFDPAGVGARDAQECLAIQLRQLDEETPWRAEAQRVISRHFDALVKHQQSELRQQLNLSEEQLGQVIELIRSLNPRPGSSIAQSKTQYIEPDIIVTRLNGRWRVAINPDNAPRIRINSLYADMIQRGNQSRDNQTMRNHLQEARWLLKSLRSRNETLLRVSEYIVSKQQAFFEQGPEAMNPMVMRELAEALDLHESTISRATSNKYMLTPLGIFELKYFFSSHVGTDSGGECSATAIRAMIKKLVKEETPNKPLSDNKMTLMLNEQGIAIARRTVAKYRESMAIPPSSDRKRLI